MLKYDHSWPYRVVANLVAAYWVCQLIFTGQVSGSKEIETRKEALKNKKESGKLVDWDYAGLQLVPAVSDTDKVNYYNLQHMRRQRLEEDPNLKKTESREKYEIHNFRQLYNNVFSTKPPHLRSSHENYIQHCKDEFFAKQREPENPKTSRERYEWHVKKNQGSFFGGKYDFDTYLAGNFTARRRRRAIDVGDKHETDHKYGDIESEELKTMKFSDSVANIMKRIQEKLQKSEYRPKNNVNLETKRDAHNQSAFFYGALQYIGNRKEVPCQEMDTDKGIKINDEDAHFKAFLNRKNEDFDEGYIPDENWALKTRKKSRPNIRAIRVRRAWEDIYINPKKSNWNRSWYLDPRNPWNKNLRYIKHAKFFDAIYMDIFERTGSDKLPSNETFCKINPPRDFWATKHPWSEKIDSQPLSYYVKEMEKMGKSLPKSDNEEIIYGRPSKDFRREERNKNYTNILKLEELEWKKQISRIKHRLRLKNITKEEHDKLVENVEKDKKVKYKLYRTRTTKHIIRQAMEALSLAADFAQSFIERDKRDVGNLNINHDHADSISLDKTFGIKKSISKGNIRNRRIKRNTSNVETNLEHLFTTENVLASWQHGSYHPPSNMEKKLPRFMLRQNRQKPFDYEPIARHNAAYYDADDSEEYSNTLATKAPSTPSTTTTTKKTTPLPPEEIARRTQMLKEFTQDQIRAYSYADKMEAEYMALKEKHNRTFSNRKRRHLGEQSIHVKDLRENLNKLLDTNKLGEEIIRNKKAKFDSVHVGSIFSWNNDNLFAKEHLRHKRDTLGDLMKGPPPDKFDQKKTKLEVDAAEAAKKPGVKEMTFEGADNVEKQMFQMYEGNINKVNVHKETNVNYDFTDSRRDPEHPDNNRVEVHDWGEHIAREYAEEQIREYDYSLGIRDRMYRDYLKLKNETEVGRVDRRVINRMELERAQKERAEFLKRNPMPTTTEKELTTYDPKDLSSFQEKERKEHKKMSAKDRLKEKVKELQDLRMGIL